jgi:hypothetical protein
MHLLIYAKVVDSKKKGLALEGPYFLELQYKGEADRSASRICTESRDVVLTRVFDLDKISYEEAVAQAKGYFSHIYHGMSRAADVLEKPPTRRRRKRAIPESDLVDLEDSPPEDEPPPA